MPVLATTDATWVNDAAVSYDAAELRRADAAIFSAGGAASGLTVTVDGSDLVTVTAGRWVIDGSVTVSGTGVYRGGIGAAASVALDARDATYSRIDLVVARQYDPDVVGSHTESKGKVEIITGTPAASPSAPAKPSLAVELARITVPASGGGAASVSTAQRQTATLLGGKLVQSGELTISLNNESSKIGTVVYPQPFGGVPTVVAMSSHQGVSVNGRATTTTSVDLRAWDVAGANRTNTITVSWIAVGPA